MQRSLKRVSVIFICCVLITVSFVTSVAMAATGIYELTFDNLFVFEQWANNPNMKVLSSDEVGGTLTTDVSKGSFVLVNNTAGTEVFTSYSMDSIASFYSMPVESNTEYIFKYNANGTTTDFETFVFYFDNSGKYISNEAKNAYQYGDNEWMFTTPENAGYIQVRFDNNTPNSNATVTDIRICAKEVYEYSKDNIYRKTFNFSAGSVYGALPVPEREGLVFAGWYTRPNGGGEQITANTVASPASKSLYSKWDPIIAGELKVVSQPENLNYCVGEKINTRGLVIGVTYPDGTSENIDEGFKCSPQVFTTVGTHDVTVTYGNSTTSFKVNVTSSVSKTVSINGTQKTADFANNVYTLDYSGAPFNRYVVKYTSDAYVKGEFSFNGTVEEFFLEPKENGEFSGYIDGFISGTTQTAITNVKFTSLNKESMNFELQSIDLSKATNPGDSSGMVYLSDSSYKIGIDLDWGGALTYMEDLTNTVMSSVKKYGTKTTEVDFKSKVSTSSILNSTSSNVNLINAHDTGRLVQQSYYGTGSYPYEPGMYGEAVWNYNPVQGGNLYNEASKIVDVKVTENELYIKCRPLDWAKQQQYITPSYMEAWYTLENGMMRATCRFVDYSGYPGVTTTQELPAFYCVEPLNDFVYYSGGEPWSDSNQKINRTDLGFWGTATDQDFICNENWAAFKGDDDDSFAIGIYCPGQTLFHTGVYYGGNGSTRCSTTSPATEDPTSYMGIVDILYFQSYSPISYCYYITTGKVDTIRSTFKTVAQEKTDVCDATNTNGFCDMCGKYVEPQLTTDKYDIDGNGTKDSVYEISNAGELHWFRDMVNGGNVNANAILTCDITDNASVLSDYGTVSRDSESFKVWEPIGNAATPYNGKFDGQGYTINGLYMNSTTTSYSGLFGYTGASAVITGVGVDDSCFVGNRYVGSICGFNGGKIENCYSFYTIIEATDKYAGGIVGYNNGGITNCYNMGIVNAVCFVGGIAGDMNIGASFANAFYLSGSATDGAGTVQNGTGGSIKGSTATDPTGIYKKSVEQFGNGEVAFLLQSSCTEQLWGQIANPNGAGPVFDKTGKYKVTSVSNTGNFSLVDIGDIDSNEKVDVQDFQQLVNQALNDETYDYGTLLKSDFDGDGYIDVVDCSIMQLIINGFDRKVNVYIKGDFDCDGIPFTQSDVAEIKKGLINQNKLNTRQKYACDLNFDGVLDIKDKDFLLDQDLGNKPVFADIDEVIGMRNKVANVIIISGQSNAYGASPLTQAVRNSVGNTDFSNVNIKYNNINSGDGGLTWKTYYSNSGFETFRVGIGGQAETWFGPELGLSYFLATDNSTKDETWYIIKYTAAGTFLGGYWLYDTTGKYLNADNSDKIYSSLGGYLADNMVSYVGTALDDIAGIHGTNNVNIRAFMWHQGESDSIVKEWADQYGDLQNILVNKVRDAFTSRDADGVIGFVDGGIAAYNGASYVNGLTGATQTYNSWTYSDTVNTHKTNNASLWYVPVTAQKNIINITSAGVYQNNTSSTTILPNSIWIDTSTCKSKLEENNENGEYDGAHYCGDSMFKIGQWYGYGMTQVSNL